MLHYGLLAVQLLERLKSIAPGKPALLHYMVVVKCYDLFSIYTNLDLVLVLNLVLTLTLNLNLNLRRSRPLPLEGRPKKISQRVK